MPEDFVYDWSSPVATRYLIWLDAMVSAQKKRRAFFAVLSVVFALIAVLVAILLYRSWGGAAIAAGAVLIILAAVMLTDNVRGRPICDLVGAAVHDFPKMNEFDVGKLERVSLMSRHDVEEQNLLYCLRISTHLRRLKDVDVITSHWENCANHGGAFFTRSLRGGLVGDFLSKLYAHHLCRAIDEFTGREATAISSLKTPAAIKRRREKATAKLQKISEQWPEFCDLIHICIEELNHGKNC